MRLSIPRGNTLHIPYSIPELGDTLSCQQSWLLSLLCALTTGYWESLIGVKEPISLVMFNNSSQQSHLGVSWGRQMILCFSLSNQSHCHSKIPCSQMSEYRHCCCYSVIVLWMITSCVLGLVRIWKYMCCSQWDGKRDCYLIGKGHRAF